MFLGDVSSNIIDFPRKINHPAASFKWSGPHCSGLVCYKIFLFKKKRALKSNKYETSSQIRLVVNYDNKFVFSSLIKMTKIINYIPFNISTKIAVHFILIVKNYSWLIFSLILKWLPVFHLYHIHWCQHHRFFYWYWNREFYICRSVRLSREYKVTPLYGSGKNNQIPYHRKHFHWTVAYYIAPVEVDLLCTPSTDLHQVLPNDLLILQQFHLDVFEHHTVLQYPQHQIWWLKHDLKNTWTQIKTRKVWNHGILFTCVGLFSWW